MKEKKRIGHDDRINLQAAIAKGWTLAQTAKLLSKSRSTVYREIANNATVKDCRRTCSHCAKSCAAGQRPALPGRPLPAVRGPRMREVEGLALLLQRMPRKPILRGQEAILRLRRRGRPLHKEPARPKGIQRHLRRGDRKDGLHRLGRGPERAIPAPHIRVRRIAEGHLLREDRRIARRPSCCNRSVK